METLLLFIILMRILTGTSIVPFSIVSSTKIILHRCKENRFYSLPLGQAEASIYSPNVISTSPPNFLMSRIDFVVLL